MRTNMGPVLIPGALQKRAANSIILTELFLLSVEEILDFCALFCILRDTCDTSESPMELKHFL